MKLYKKFIGEFIMFCLVLVSLMSASVFAAEHTHSYTNGICSSCGAYQPAVLNGSTYEISNAGQLFWFASLINGDTTQEGITAAVADANAILTTDIDLNSREWTPIGNYAGSSSLCYNGTFDGKGYTVSGLYINSTSNQQGLFGYVKSGTVQNVTVSGTVIGSREVGGVAGTNKGTVTNCTNSATVSASTYTGGVVGLNTGTVINCYNSGSITGNGFLGGVVGYNDSNSSVTNCFNSGSVTSNASGYDYVGGVVGNSFGSVTNCFNSSVVSGYMYVGGVVGNNAGPLSYSYNSGNVSGNSYVGGVVGNNFNNGSIIGSVTNCYYLSSTASAAIGTGSNSVTNVESKTSTQFASGEVTWLLTGGTTDGTQAWYQTLGTDSYPVLDSTHGTVYYNTTTCGGSAAPYSNSSSGGHTGYDTYGFCTNCGGYQPAVLNNSGIYEISNPGQLFWFAALVNGDTTQEGITAAVPSANAILTSNIDLGKTTSTHTSTEWTPIGSESAPFSGTFDLGGYTVSNMTITTAADYLGFFGYVTGTVKNGKVQGSIEVTGNSMCIGGITGSVCNGTISNLSSKVFIMDYDGTKGCAGGVAGEAIGTDGTKGSTVEHCIFSDFAIDVRGTLDCVGGIVGYMNAATINNCYIDSTIVTRYGTKAASAGIYTGGIVGYCNNANSVITNCHSYSTIMGAGDNTTDDCYTGGIIGRINASIGSLENCYYYPVRSDIYGSYEGAGANGSGIEIEAVLKTESEFKSGEVAWLLQNANTDYVWGQKISSDVYPVFTDDTGKKVVKVSFYRAANGVAEAEPIAYGYINSGNAYTDYPTDSSYTFYSDVNLSNEITDTAAYTFTSDGIVYVKQAYSVTNTLTNITNSNTAAAINYGESYSATLTAASGYDLPDSITVTVGGTELTAGTDYTYDSSTGALSISSVTGDIVITAEAVEAEPINVTVKQNYVPGYTLVLVERTSGSNAYAYDGNAMYDVTEAGYIDNSSSIVFAYIVYDLNSELTAETAKAQVTAVADAAGTIEYDCDINGTGTVTWDDAAAVHYISNAVGFEAQYIPQFLRADVNHDGVVDDTDVSTVYSAF